MKISNFKSDKSIYMHIQRNKMPKGKTNESNIISMVKAFIALRRRHFNHNCLIIIACPVDYGNVKVLRVPKL